MSGKTLRVITRCPGIIVTVPDTSDTPAQVLVYGQVTLEVGEKITVRFEEKEYRYTWTGTQMLLDEECDRETPVKEILREKYFPEILREIKNPPDN